MSSRGAEPHDREPARQPTLAAYAPEPVLPPAASAPDWRSRQGRWVDRSLSGRHHLPCCRGLFRPVAKSNPCTIPRSKRQRPSYRSRPHTPNLWTVPKPPVLDWFHIAMRLQHAKLASSSLSTDEPGRMEAKAFIIEQVERLRWRIWNGNAKNAQITIERIRKVMHVFRGESSHRTTGAPARKLWHALHEVDKYLIGQSDWLVNYAKRRRASLRVGTSITEGTANFL